MPSILRIVTLGLAVLALMASRVEADVVILDQNGRIEGLALPHDPESPKTVTIQTDHGIRVTLATSRIQERIKQRANLVEYKRIRPRYKATIEGEWELAQWCRDHHLTEQREMHLRRILELDENHERARHALGYNKRDNDWTTREEQMAKMGYQRYKGGRYMLPQEIEILEAKRTLDLRQKEWAQKLRRFSGWLGTDKDRIARESIQQIDDPYAVKALADLLRSDQNDRSRMIYVDALTRIDDSSARKVLTIWSMEDPIAEVGLTCLDHLKKVEDHEALDYFIDKLRSKLNPEVNRAATALGHLEASKAIRPLIDALVTVHKYKISKGNPGQMSTRFPTGGGGSPGGFSFGGGGTKIHTQYHQNRAVLDTLVKLTGGKNFSFDIAAWKSWYLTNQRPNPFDRRRD